MNDKLAEYQQRVEALLSRFLPLDSNAKSKSKSKSKSRLSEAMRYSVLDGGKRVRPLLVYATGEALKLSVETLDAPAAAIELIHVYSLIHDDLPAMDDDDLRRGKATAHIAYDEAMAILSGDALQTRAFDILSQPLHGVCAENQLKIINILSNAAGMQGMVEGQAIDLAAVGKQLTESQLEVMHHHKTGALIRASVLMASFCHESTVTESATENATENATESDDAIRRESLLNYAEAIGLAFQVHDDILDIESDTETLGKQQGADIAAGKPTYPSIIGIEKSKKKAFDLHQSALDSLAGFGEEADLLREIAGFIVKRLS